MNKEIKKLDLMIIGGGPAGLTASIYAARAKMKMILIEDAILGGQIRNSYLIENYPGFKNIDGQKLATLMQEQAEEQGATIDEFDFIEKVKLSDSEKEIETSNCIYNVDTLIISTGATPKKLPIASEEMFLGKGVHYCAVCDGAMYTDKIVAVIGGGNSALEEANFLTRFTKKVIMIRRHEYFNGETSLIKEVEQNPKIEIMYNWDLIDVYGEKFMEGAKIRNTKTNEKSDLKIDAIFGYIGTEPKTKLFKDYINLNKQGYIITDEDMQTNVKGVYAAGDVREKEFRQITTAVADGTIAALHSEKYINK